MIPVKAAIAMGINPVDDDDDRCRRRDHLCRQHHQWLRQKTDQRTKLDSQETAQNGSKWLWSLDGSKL